MNEKAKYLLKLIGITGAVYLGFRYLLPLVILFVLALLCARGMAPIINWCYIKFHISKKITAPVFLLLLILIVGGFLVVLSIALADQVTGLIYSIPQYKNIWYEKMLSICVHCDGMFGLVKGNSLKFMEEVISQASTLAIETIVPTMAGLAGKIVLMFFEMLISIFIFFISVLMFLSDRKKIRRSYKKFPLRKQVQPVLTELKRNGLIYVKAQSIIITIVSLVCAACLFFIGNKYYLLFGITIGILDALPVLGSGIVFVPWAFISAFNGNYLTAAILFTGYIITLVVREVMEPRLLGNSMGILPVFMLMSIFVGVSLFGVLGFVLGPIGFVLIKTLMETKLSLYD